MQRVFRKYRDRLDLRFASDAATAFELVKRGGFDVVISDMQMPGENGLQLLDRVRAADPSIYRVLMSGGLAPDVELQAQSIAHVVLEKPCPSSLLLSLFGRVEDVRQPRLSYCV